MLVRVTKNALGYSVIMRVVSQSLFHSLPKSLRRMGGGMMGMIYGSTKKLVSVLKYAMEDSNAMKSIKSNLILSTNFNKSSASAA